MDDLITKYFENTLSDRERSLFERELSENESFRSEFKFQKELQNAIQVSERQKIKSSIQKFEAAKVVHFNIKRLYPYAAILVLALGVWFMFKTEPTPQDLYSDYFNMYPNVVAPISRSTQEPTLKQVAFENYELGNYDKALEAFIALEQENTSEQSIIQIYKANIYLSTNQPQKAFEELQTPTDPSVEWEDKKMWYLALTYLKLENTEKAKETLQALSHIPQNFKKQETLALLKSLQ